MSPVFETERTRNTLHILEHVGVTPSNKKTHLRCIAHIGVYARCVARPEQSHTTHMRHATDVRSRVQTPWHISVCTPMHFEYQNECVHAAPHLVDCMPTALHGRMQAALHTSECTWDSFTCQRDTSCCMIIVCIIVYMPVCIILDISSHTSSHASTYASSYASLYASSCVPSCVSPCVHHVYIVCFRVHRRMHHSAHCRIHQRTHHRVYQLMLHIIQLCIQTCISSCT